MDFHKLPIFAESWNVAWRKKPAMEILKDTDTPFIVIPNSFRYWAADPFVIESKEGKTYIFAELYDYIRHRGVLGYCRLDQNVRVKWYPVIEEPYHLSFPFIFADKNDIYIIPESSASHELYIYKAIRFPDEWIRVKTIRSDIKVVDTTVFQENGHTFALTYNIEDIHNPRLYLLDVEDLNNDKEIACSNQDLRRPAGRINEEMKIRPAQNCIEDYGKGLVFYKYDMRNSVYAEKELYRFYPQDICLNKKLYLDGMHTYNWSENYEVIDIKTRRFNLLNLVMRVWNKISSGRRPV